VEMLVPYASTLTLHRYQTLWRRLGEPISTFYVIVRGAVLITGLGVTRVAGAGTAIAGGAWMRENLTFTEALATEPTELLAVRASAVKAAAALAEKTAPMYTVDGDLWHNVLGELCAKLRETVGFAYSMMLLSQYIPYFTGQPIAVVRKLAHLFRMRVFQQGDTLLTQGEAAREVYFLVVGEVSVRTPSRDGRRTIELSRLSERDEYTSIGELSLVSTKKHKATMHRSASVVALERCLCLEASASEYGEVLHLVPELREHVQRLRDLHAEKARFEKETQRAEMESARDEKDDDEAREKPATS